MNSKLGACLFHPVYEGYRQAVQKPGLSKPRKCFVFATDENLPSTRSMCGYSPRPDGIFKMTKDKVEGSFEVFLIPVLERHLNIKCSKFPLGPVFQIKFEVANLLP